MKASLLFWEDNSDVIQYCYISASKKKSRTTFVMENLAQHKNFQKVSIYRQGLSENMSLIKSIISPPFLFRSKQSGLTNPSTKN